MAQEKIPVAVVEDHPVTRAGLKEFLEEGPFRVVVRASDGEDYIAQSSATPVKLALVDLIMPRMNGWVTIAWIRDHQPDVRSLALTADPTPEQVQRVMRVGARGVVDKSASEGELRRALEDVYQCGFHHNRYTERYLLAPTAAREAEPEGLALLARLTAREREVFDLVLHDPPLTYERIALRLKLSVHTVEDHRKSIGKKLNVHSREGVVRFAARYGVLS